MEIWMKMEKWVRGGERQKENIEVATGVFSQNI